MYYYQKGGVVINKQRKLLLLLYAIIIFIVGIFFVPTDKVYFTSPHNINLKFVPIWSLKTYVGLDGAYSYIFNTKISLYLLTIISIITLALYFILDKKDTN